MPLLDALLEIGDQRLRQAPYGPSLGLATRCWKLSQSRQPPRLVCHCWGIARDGRAMTRSPLCSPAFPARANRGANLWRWRRDQQAIPSRWPVQPTPPYQQVTVRSPKWAAQRRSCAGLRPIKTTLSMSPTVCARKNRPTPPRYPPLRLAARGNAQRIGCARRRSRAFHSSMVGKHRLSSEQPAGGDHMPAHLALPGDRGRTA